MISHTKPSITPTKRIPWRQFVMTLQLNAVFPFIVSSLLMPHFSPLLAQLLACALPAFEMAKKKQLNPIGVQASVSLLLSSLATFVLKNPRLLMYQGALASVLFGLTFLLSFFQPKSPFFSLVRSFVTAHTSLQMAQFDGAWAQPEVRSLYRLLTFVWGSVTIVAGVLQALVAFRFPPTQVPLINQVLTTLFLGSLSIFTVISLRRSSHIARAFAFSSR